MNSAKNTWQRTPIRLAEQALQHIEEETEFSRQIAYLLVDLTVETTLKAYLLFPDRVSGAMPPHDGDKRMKRKSNFHGLVKDVVASVSDSELTAKLESLAYYHDIRNKLYQEGDGIIPSREVARDYAAKAIDILNALLRTNMRVPDDVQGSRVEESKRLARLKEQWRPIAADLSKLFREINKEIASRIEQVDPTWENARGTFLRELDDYISALATPEGGTWKQAIRRFARDEEAYIIDDDANAVVSIPYDDMGSRLEHLLESPRGLKYPKAIADFFSHGDYHEFDWELIDKANVLLSDDVDEAMMLMAFQSKKVDWSMDLELYYRIRELAHIDFDRPSPSYTGEKELDKLKSEVDDLVAMARQTLDRA